MSASISLDGNTLVYRTPYDPALVAALKTAVPASDRRWDPARRAWLVAPAHSATLQALAQQYLGLDVPAPQVATTPLDERRLLDVRYVGATKGRGDGGERTAFAWVGGAWSAVFPESVLRAWFHAEARPGGEHTFYSALGLRTDAAGIDVRAAYRRLARQWHPDRCSEPDAAEQFRAVQHAYEILSDPARRARYDAGLALAAVAASTISRRDGHTQRRADGYRPPLRCGYVVATGYETVGRFVVRRVDRWEDITDRHGRVLVTSWPLGAEAPVEEWL